MFTERKSEKQLHLAQLIFIYSHNIYVMGHLFSRPCLCFGLVLEMQFSTPPRETKVIDVIVMVIVFSLVKLRRGRLNYVGANRAGKFCVADAS